MTRNGHFSRPAETDPYVKYLVSLRSNQLLKSRYLCLFLNWTFSLLLVKEKNKVVLPRLFCCYDGEIQLQCRQLYFTIWTQTFYNLYNYILQFGWIHFTIWTNTFILQVMLMGEKQGCIAKFVLLLWAELPSS